MKTKLFTTLCIVALLTANVACGNQRKADVTTDTPKCSLYEKQQFDSLRQLVYRGDDEAALQLASYYIEGKGVELSYLNAACIHSVLDDYAEGDIDPIIFSYSLDDPYRILMEPIIWGWDDASIFDSESFAMIKKVLPLEAEAILAYDNYEGVNEEETKRYQKELERLERKGSEVSVFYQLPLFRDEKLDGGVDAYMSFLDRHSDRFPIFNEFLGNLYLGKYVTFGIPQYLDMAIFYYNMAKSYGMLGYRGMRYLSQINEFYEEQGLVPAYKVSIP